eukprot:6173205-Pleurochrysis_carterae.AAC.3
MAVGEQAHNFAYITRPTSVHSPQFPIRHTFILIIWPCCSMAVAIFWAFLRFKRSVRTVQVNLSLMPDRLHPDAAGWRVLAKCMDIALARLNRD